MQIATRDLWVANRQLQNPTFSIKKTTFWVNDSKHFNKKYKYFNKNQHFYRHFHLHPHARAPGNTKFNTKTHRINVKSTISNNQSNSFNTQPVCQRYCAPWYHCYSIYILLLSSSCGGYRVPPHPNDALDIVSFQTSIRQYVAGFCVLNTWRSFAYWIRGGVLLVVVSLTLCRSRRVRIDPSRPGCDCGMPNLVA